MTDAELALISDRDETELFNWMLRCKSPSVRQGIADELRRRHYGPIADHPFQPSQDGLWCLICPLAERLHPKPKPRPPERGWRWLRPRW